MPNDDRINEFPDEQLATAFFAIVQQAEAWPTLADELASYNGQRAAFQRDICTAVSSMVAYVAIRNGPS